jgi:hypothetical protein
LSALDHFDKVLDKIIARYGVQVVEVENHYLGLSGRILPVDPSPKGSLK